MGLAAAFSLAENPGVGGAVGILADGWIASASQWRDRGRIDGLPPKHPRLRNVQGQCIPGAEESQMRVTLPASTCSRHVSQNLSARLQNASAVFPLRLAALDYGAEAFLRIFQAVKLVEEQMDRAVHGVAKRESHATDHGPLGHGEDRAGLRGDLRAERVHGFLQLGLRYDAIEQAQFESAFGADGFAGEHKLESLLWADQARQNGCRERREHADGARK